MTYKTIGAAALCVMMSSVATAEINADQSSVRYESSIAVLPILAHQAQLTSVATMKTWAPSTFTTTSAAGSTEHQAQQVAAATQVTWTAATYAAKDLTKVTLPLQHQAQLVELMTQHDWKVSAANLNN